MILCIGTTPAVQRVLVFRKLVLDSVNRAATTLDGAAGKSINVAKVLRTLGERPIATGFLGGDRGEYLRAVLAEKGIVSEFVSVNARTRLCITLIDEATGHHTELVEESQPVEPCDYEKLKSVIRQRVTGCRALIMSGTITPGGPPGFYYDCAQIAREAGLLSVIDAHGTSLQEALKARPGVVKPNRLELASTLGRELNDEPALLEAMRDLHQRGAERVVVTGGKGATLAFNGHSFWRVIPPRITPVNPIGCGDAFTAGLVWRLLRGEALGEACRWANAVGVANALTLMPGELNYSDLEPLAEQAKVEQVF